MLRISASAAFENIAKTIVDWQVREPTVTTAARRNRLGSLRRAAWQREISSPTRCLSRPNIIRQWCDLNHLIDGYEIGSWHSTVVAVTKLAGKQLAEPRVKAAVGVVIRNRFAGQPFPQDIGA